ncbi:nucleotidyl transferase AbiEii/AbiGii toxin family protein [Yersinia enterocolitica]|uniref:nucleotidyl transferase AbiEii/AbiGii toxin family protein n=1 Tax=Yersinia enterocolitica TaxID=630 RepID=UPI00398CCFCD
MDKLSMIFADVADALGIGATSIVEKDYYVIELLRLLQPLIFETHQLVFAGGTSLAKSGIKLNRMSEDVDIKLIPNPDFLDDTHFSRSQRKNTRKEIIEKISDIIIASELFKFDKSYPRIARDEYRYNDIQIQYPQEFTQVPCLRPFIKLELMESDLLEPAELRNISSFVYELAGKGSEISAFPCTTIISTQAEKIVAMMRRTAAFMRNVDRKDDESLVRHIYDNYRIVDALGLSICQLSVFVQQTIQLDIERYGCQHPQLKANAIDELKTGLDEIGSNPYFKERYGQFVVPMVFENSRVEWEEVYHCFRQTALETLKCLDGSLAK